MKRKVPILAVSYDLMSGLLLDPEGDLLILEPVGLQLMSLGVVS
jgi:hypothetical protein